MISRTYHKNGDTVYPSLTPISDKFKRLKKKKRNRYRISKKAHRMTLIIGVKCIEGIALIGDTKVTDLENNIPLWQNKIITPLPNLPVIVGASGYSNLFWEFNRKLPIIVNQRVNEIILDNIQALMKSGMTREEAIKHMELIDKLTKVQAQKPIELESTTKDNTKKHTSQKNPLPPLPYPPYVYHAEKFIDDCKSLVKEVSEQFLDEHPYPLEVLVGLYTAGSLPSLRHIDSKGKETEVSKCCIIGSGSPHVKMLFDRFWRGNEQIHLLNAIAFACFAVKYVQDMNIDNFVGVEEGKSAQVMIILNDGTYGPINSLNEKEFLDDAKSKISEIDKYFKALVEMYKIIPSVSEQSYLSSPQHEAPSQPSSQPSQSASEE